MFAPSKLLEVKLALFLSRLKKCTPDDLPPEELNCYS
jgi:hypothetical protein